nr:UDP-N-acetylmuramoylalanyl-D-glutamyl-2,6-diaminopimelate--D-alanyl-D-alanine ligase [Pseudovibrio hongkongensis]
MNAEEAPLWTLPEFLDAVGGDVLGEPNAEITGISIDSRSLCVGDAFFAIAGEAHDGHSFLEKAMEAGASIAVVAQEKLEDLPEGGRYVVVRDVLHAMERLGQRARARMQGRVIAVTGSVGKTGSKEALRLCLEAAGKTHAPVASFNNHWGVPLTLARMPRDTEFGIFEIGMNHAGEITPLVKMVRPHVAIVTTVEPVHMEFFELLEDVAKAKAEIFAGLEPGGSVILNRDNRQHDLLRYLAVVAGVQTIHSFGLKPGADATVTQLALNADCSCLTASILGQEITYKIGAPGEHHVINSLAVLAGVVALGADLALAGLALADMQAPKGRGEQVPLEIGGGAALLLDESYNANPASMEAALKLLGTMPVTEGGRRIAVLGDMREMGVDAAKHHRNLSRCVRANDIDLVYCVGTLMQELWDALPEGKKGANSDDSRGLKKRLVKDVRAGDVIMIKGSLGTRMAPLVEALRKKYSAVVEQNEA